MTVGVLGHIGPNERNIQVEEKKVLDAAFDTVCKTKKLSFVINREKGSESPEYLSFKQEFSTDDNLTREQTVYVSYKFFKDLQQKLLDKYGSIRFGDTIGLLVRDPKIEGDAFSLIARHYVDKDNKSPRYVLDSQLEYKSRLLETTILID